MQSSFLYGFSRWLAVTTLLNVIWEVAQLPLYTIWNTSSWPGLAFAVLHCSAGDAMISGVCYAVTTIVLRDGRWPVSNALRGLPTVVVFGLAYTTFSEWKNVYEIGSWAYSPAMPLVFKIGLAPLLQWLVVPVLSFFILRARSNTFIVTAVK